MGRDKRLDFLALFAKCVCSYGNMYTYMYIVHALGVHVHVHVKR